MVVGNGLGALRREKAIHWLYWYAEEIRWWLTRGRKRQEYACAVRWFWGSPMRAREDDGGL